MAFCNLQNFGPCFGQFREIQLFLRNLTDFVNYNKPLNKRKKTPSEDFDDDVVPDNCDVIAIFLTSAQFGAIWKLDSVRIICKTILAIKR